MKKFLLSLAAACMTAFTANAESTVTLDFVGWNFDGASEWTSSYAEHTVNFTDATVYFTKANRQSETMAISDCPVTKGFDIVVTAKSQITSASVLFKQWNTKTKTVNLVVNGETKATTEAFAFDNVAVGSTTFTLSFTEESNQIGVQSITLVLDGEAVTPEVAAPVITPSTGTYNEPQTVTITAADGCKIYYTLDGSEPNDAATAYAEPFVVSETTTVKAVAVNDEDTQSAVATSVITIQTLKSIANTLETAYTTAEAIALIDDPTSDLSDSVYVKGVVSNVDSYNTKYGSLTYWLDDKTFEIYSGKGLNGEDPQSEDYLAATDTVIVYGVIKKYGTSTYEMDKNNYIVYIGKGPGPSVSIANTPETAYTVAKAFELIDAGEGLDEKVYVKGIISSIKEVSVDWGNATYFISDDGTTSKELEIYRGYSVGGEKFTAEDEIKVGDAVIVYGKLVLYGTTYEFTTGSSIYSINGSTSAIKRVNEDKTIDLSNAVIYNVLGKRVYDMSKKGIYIVNGKKYVVK